MNDIEIFVTHTPNRKCQVVHNELMKNIIAGAVFDNGTSDLLRDNIGDNISFKNKSYCELTTQYWAWKNVKADYYGFFHYRRFFSFSNEELPESAWGSVEYDFLTDREIEALHLNEEDMRKKINGIDFMIAKGVDVTKMPVYSKSVYNQYEQAGDLHIKDYDCMLQIINEKYPFLNKAAQSYTNGTKLYSCNMFIMKDELFKEYSEILFNILEEFEKRTDMSLYSREGYRTTGHLGERILGIYYTYIKSLNKYKTSEQQVALIHDVSVQEEHKYIQDAVPVVLAADNNYVPVLSVCLKSIVDNSNPERIYDIVVFHKDITPQNQKIIKQMFLENNNIVLSFINVKRNVQAYVLKAKEHISTETFYRFLILDILSGYDKVVYLDSDLVLLKDVAKLYDEDLGDNYIGAAHDPDFCGQINIRELETREYCDNVLKLDKAEDYFQAGVLLLNVRELNRVTNVTSLFEMADTGIYKYSDQDILNIICRNKVKYIDMAWNYIYDCNHDRYSRIVVHASKDILEMYENARTNPYIIHYAGFLKPWQRTDQEYAEIFWRIARDTPYYETLLFRMSEGISWHMTRNMTVNRPRFSLRKKICNAYFSLFPEGTRRRQFIRKNIKVIFKKGKFGKKVIKFFE